MKIDVLALRNELIGRIYCNMTGASYDDTADLKIPTETEIREMFQDYEDYEVFIDMIDDGIIGNLVSLKPLEPISATDGYKALEGAEEEIYSIAIKKGDDIIYSVEDEEIKKSLEKGDNLDDLIERFQLLPPMDGYSRNSADNPMISDDKENEIDEL